MVDFLYWLMRTTRLRSMETPVTAAQTAFHAKSYMPRASNCALQLHAGCRVSKEGTDAGPSLAGERQAVAGVLPLQRGANLGRGALQRLELLRSQRDALGPRLQLAILLRSSTSGQNRLTSSYSLRVMTDAQPCSPGSCSILVPHWGVHAQSLCTS